MKLLTTTGVIIFENEKPTLKETIFDAIQSGIRNMDDIDLSSQTLSGIDLSGLSLNGAYFKDASITDSKFVNCNFESGYFELASFDKCNFSKSEFIEAYFSTAGFKDCCFRDAKIKGQTFTNYDSVKFIGSDMTGVRMRKIDFNYSDFSDVSMQQSVLHQINFRGCHFSGMSLKKSFLILVCLYDNFGKIDMAGVNAADSSLIDVCGRNTDLEFFSEPFKIDPENIITVYRYNYGNISPFMNSTWDNDSKAVCSKSGFGIYGYSLDMSGCTALSTAELGLNVREKMNGTSNRSKIRVIIELQVDKRRVLYKGANKIAFSECNIMGVVTPEAFILKHHPQCKSLIDLYYKAIDNPDLYGNKYIQEEGRQCAQLRSLTASPDNSDASKLEIIKAFAVSNSKPSDIHGLSHWQNVERNAMLLSPETGADLQTLKIFAYVHDMCRENDGSDPNHGLRASKVLKKYSATLMGGIEERNIYRVCFACENHTTLLRSGDALIDTCFDADRLDLLRVGITPDPEKMATEIGAYYAANPDIYNAEIAKVKI